MAVNVRYVCGDRRRYHRDYVILSCFNPSVRFANCRLRGWATSLFLLSGCNRQYSTGIDREIEAMNDEETCSRGVKYVYHLDEGEVQRRAMEEILGIVFQILRIRVAFLTS